MTTPHVRTALLRSFSSNDIGPPPSWDNLFRIINQVVPITQFAGPGGWNDLDMLEVGNEGLTLPEQQTHFAFWAAVKSPLIISTDLTNISPEALSILNNTRIIALSVSYFVEILSAYCLTIRFCSKMNLENLLTSKDDTRTTMTFGQVHCPMAPPQ